MPNSIILQGDCVEQLRRLPANSIDAVVTDPPYGLSKEPDVAEVMLHWLALELREHAAAVVGVDAALRMFPSTSYEHTGGGFMGKTWDSFVPGPDVWREVYRVLKPGGHALSFSGTRTYDLMTMAMRIAGFEIRDQLAWMYGTGFPKSLDVSKAIDALAGAVREVISERPAYGLGDGRSLSGHAPGATAKVTAPATPEAQQWSGWGTALKPAQEPIVLARKPFCKGATVASNVLAHGTGGLNIDGCRIGDSKRVPGTPKTASASTHTVSMPGYDGGSGHDPNIGRWPANVILDEVAAAALDEQSDTGGASRFFYVAKASKAEREAGLEHLPARVINLDTPPGTQGANSPRAGAGRGGARRNHHPTVKPVALMRYLIRLITPPGGVVLDPFTGSGTTGIASVLEDRHFIGCELSPEYVTIAEARIEHARGPVRGGEAA